MPLPGRLTCWGVGSLIFAALLGVAAPASLFPGQGAADGARCDLVSGQPRLYGRVHHKQVLNPELWFPSGGPRRRAKFFEFLQTNESAVQAPGGPPLPLRGGCTHIIKVNDKYKIMFIKNTKSAGTSLMLAFGPLNGNCDTCLRTIRADEEHRLMEMYKDYFVFTVVRNPFDRAVSSYEYILSLRKKHWDPHNHERAARCPAPSFREFCDRPYVLGLQDLQHTCYTAKEKARNGVLGENHDFVHAEPVHQCLFTEAGQPAFDYAIRMDRIRPDFEEMRIHHLNTAERRKNGVPGLPRLPISWERKPTSGAVPMNRHMAKYIQCGDSCISAVSDYYAQDIRLFGYPANEEECLRRQEGLGEPGFSQGTL